MAKTLNTKSAFRMTATLALSAAIFAAGCGSQNEGNEVLSLENDSADGLGTPADAAVINDNLTAEQKAANFTSCIRENGFDDFPDVEVDADDSIEPEVAFAALNGQEGAREARRECMSHIEDLLFGGEGRPERSEIEENLLPVSECLRDEGLDVGDVQFGEQNEPTEAERAERQPAERDGEAGFDRSARLAERFGVDLDEADSAAAWEACADVLEEATSGFGPQGGGGPGGRG